MSRSFCQRRAFLNARLFCFYVNKMWVNFELPQKILTNKAFLGIGNYNLEIP